MPLQMWNNSVQIHDNHYSSLLAFMTHGVEHVVCGLGARYMSGKCSYADTTFLQDFHGTNKKTTVATLTTEIEIGLIRHL